jgi:hypothetical protein
LGQALERRQQQARFLLVVGSAKGTRRKGARGGDADASLRPPLALLWAPAKHTEATQELLEQRQAELSQWKVGWGSGLVNTGFGIEG